MFNFKTNPIGVNISDFSVEIAKVNKSQAVESYGRKLLNDSLIKDGRIKKKEELAEVLRNLLEKMKVETDRAIICLPHSHLFFHLFRFDEELKGREIREKVLEQAERTIPLTPDEVYWDFKKVDSPGKGTNALYVAAKKELVKDYVEVMRKANLKVVRIEPERIALGDILLSEQEQEKAIIDLGAKTINLSVFGKQNALRFTSSINFGGEDLAQIIAEEKEIGLEEAEQLKRDYGLDRSKEDNEVLPIIQKELQFPLEEIKQAFEYYENNLGGKVEKIILTGGGALLPDLDEYLSMNLNKEVELGNPLVNLSDGAYLAKEKTVDPLIFSSALGLSLGASKRNGQNEIINLLPEGLAENEKGQSENEEKNGILNKARNSKWLAGVVFGLGIAFLGFAIYSYVFKSKPEPQPPQKEPNQEATTSTSTLEQEEEEEQEKESYTIVTIQETSTGWLRVRNGPGISYDEIGRVEPQESYTLLEQENDWYKINFSENDGWVLGKHVSTSSTSTLIDS